MGTKWPFKPAFVLFLYIVLVSITTLSSSNRSNSLRISRVFSVLFKVKLASTCAFSELDLIASLLIEPPHAADSAFIIMVLPAPVSPVINTKLELKESSIFLAIAKFVSRIPTSIYTPQPNFLFKTSKKFLFFRCIIFK